jgi:hypothetical protein
MTVGSALRPGMPFGFAMICSACHGVPSSGERIVLPRPQEDAVRGQIRELANEFEIGCFKGAIRSQVPARPQGFDRLRSGFVTQWRHLRVLISLLQYRLPEPAFAVTHRTSGRKSSFDRFAVRVPNGANGCPNRALPLFGVGTNGLLLTCAFREAPYQ